MTPEETLRVLLNEVRAACAPDSGLKSPWWDNLAGALDDYDNATSGGTEYTSPDRVELDPQPVPGGETVLVDAEWFARAMQIGVPFGDCPRCDLVRRSYRIGQCATAVADERARCLEIVRRAERQWAQSAGVICEHIADWIEDEG